MRFFRGIFFCGLFYFAAMSVFAGERPLKIVTSTTFFAELVRKIGGENVEVNSIAAPRFNIHFIQPTPNDVRKTSRADLFVFAGLDLEAWVNPLLEASGRSDLFRGGSRNLDLSQGIPLLKIPAGELSRAGGDLHLFGNPHYTLNPDNAKIMAQTILNKLKELDPAHSADYQARADQLITKIDLKITEWKNLCVHCVGKEVISYHDDIVYLTHFLGVKEEQYLEPKPGVPPAPRHLAFLEEYIRKNQVQAIVAASYYPSGPAKKIAEKTGIKTGLIVQSPGEISGTEDLFDFYTHNVETIAKALS